MVAVPSGFLNSRRTSVVFASSSFDRRSTKPAGTPGTTGGTPLVGGGGVTLGNCRPEMAGASSGAAAA